MRFLKLGSFREKWKKFSQSYPTPATFIFCESCNSEQAAFSKAQLARFIKNPPKNACATCGYYLRPRKAISPDLRRQALQTDQHECVYCGATTNLTLDHVLPYSQGGKDSLENLVVACASCNRDKAAKIDFQPARFGRFRTEILQTS